MTFGMYSSGCLWGWTELGGASGSTVGAPGTALGRVDVAAALGINVGTALGGVDVAAALDGVDVAAALGGVDVAAALGRARGKLRARAAGGVGAGGAAAAAVAVVRRVATANRFMTPRCLRGRRSQSPITRCSPADTGRRAGPADSSSLRATG
jgi:hypothetical protein